MKKDGDVHSVIHALPRGTYEFKFIVDEVWRIDPNLPVVRDANGNLNNFLEVLHIKAPSEKNNILLSP